MRYRSQGDDYVAVTDNGRNVYYIAWHHDARGEGLNIGLPNEPLAADAPVDVVVAETTLRRYVQGCADHDINSRGMIVFSTLASAKAAKAAVESALAALSSAKSYPDWALKALGAGWKPPRGWKP